MFQYRPQLRGSRHIWRSILSTSTTTTTTAAAAKTTTVLLHLRCGDYGNIFPTIVVVRSGERAPLLLW